MARRQADELLLAERLRLRLTVGSTSVDQLGHLDGPAERAVGGLAPEIRTRRDEGRPGATNVGRRLLADEGCPETDGVGGFDRLQLGGRLAAPRWLLAPALRPAPGLLVHEPS